MPQPIYANNVAGTIAANIGPADTAILLGAGQGSLFPALSGGNWYYATLVHNTLGTIEIVKVTAKVADTLTVVRGQDNTSATSFTTGSLVELRLHAQMLRELDYRLAMAIANGLATLDNNAKVLAAQLLGVAPVLDGSGKIDMANIPAAVATDAELANYLPLAGGTISGNLAVVGHMSVDTGGAGAARLNVGNDAYLIDCNVANTLSVRGVANGSIGFIQYGNGHTFGWDGNWRMDGQIPWTAGNFDPASKANQSNPYIAGDVRVTSYFRSDGGYFISQAAHLVLGAQSGPIYLRPNGELNGTNQGIVNTSGLAQFVDVQSYCDKRLKRKIRKTVARNIASTVPYQQWEVRFDGRIGRGVVAQALQAAAPEHVGIDPDGYLTVDKAGVALEQSYSNEERITKLEKLVAKQAKLIERLLKKG